MRHLLLHLDDLASRDVRTDSPHSIHCTPDGRTPTVHTTPFAATPNGAAGRHTIRWVMSSEDHGQTSNSRFVMGLQMISMSQSTHANIGGTNCRHWRCVSRSLWYTHWACVLILVPMSNEVKWILFNYFFYVRFLRILGQNRVNKWLI
jgi:hypothetical protein